MFGYILISILTVIQLYVFWRAASVPLLRDHKLLLAGAGVVLWLLFLSGRILGHGSTGAVAWCLEVSGMHWMTVLFLLFVCLLAVELVTGFGFLMSRFVPSLRGAALIAGVVLSMVAFVQGLRPPVVQNYEVSLPGLSRDMDGTVIVAMSDLHLGTLLGEKWMGERVAQVQAEQSDIIFLLGDLFEGHGKPLDELLPVMRGLSAPLGVWVVPGNHEFHGGGTIELIQQAGFHLLRDRWAEVAPGLVVAGVDDLTTRHRRGLTGNHIEKALEGRPSGATILLSHTPWQTEEAAEEGVGLMLSGHTHGGQVWPFGYVVRIFYPLLEGRYDVSGMTAIVSRGTGTWGSRMRLWHPGEILRVTLRSE
ncbi:MAG: metallophosphoesterase [Deltaproteobacteria bacterium]|nr:metallophosphoesterase [Deltaproteobacteria bacterium]